MPTFKSWITETLAPAFLRKTWGVRYLGVIGEAADRMADYAKEAVKAAHPETCPDDALSYNGAARNIERYQAESTADYRAKITDPWSIWEFGGSRTAIIDRLNEQGYSAVQIKAWYELQPYVGNKWTNWPSAFWVWIDPPHGITQDGNWDDPGTWSDTVPATIAGGPPGPGTWDSNMTLYEVNELRGAVRKWKEGHEICAQISILVSGQRWEDVTPWDSGDWDDSSAMVVLPG